MRLSGYYSVARCTSSQVFDFGRSKTRVLSLLEKHARNFSVSSAPFPTSIEKRQVSGPYGSYLSEYQSSIQDRDVFWHKAAGALEWHTFPTKVLEREGPYFDRWFPDGEINTCYNCLDVHVKAGRGDQNAILYDSPVTEVKEQITYKQLLHRVAHFAGALRDLGVKQGDRVVIYMPMIPEAVVAMLACARLGAVHNVVFGGFAAPELATRIEHCQPRAIISASVGVLPGNRIIPYKPLLDRALELAFQNVKHTVIVQRRNVQECELGPMDLDYENVMANASPVDAVPVQSNDPLFVLYTSGTTGLPKGVVHDAGPTSVAWKYSMGAFYNTAPGEMFWTFSDIGWTVGSAYTVYAPLLNGSQTILFEGKPVGSPDAGAFWRVVEEYKVKTLFTAPTALRAIRQADPNAEFINKYDTSSLQTLFLAGEHSDPATLHWCENVLGCPAIDHWWQTEYCYPGVGNAVGLGRLPIKYGACSAPVPGYDIAVLDDDGNPVPPNTLGNLVIRQPLPPGALTTLYNHDDRFISEYMTKFPGYYNTGDAASIDDDGYVFIMGRTDDVINTAGHRLSTGALEEILMDHEDVAECAVVGVHDALKGEVPLAFVITKAGYNVNEDTLKEELVQKVTETLGPIACFKNVAIVSKLPKTRSGKILRGTMAKIANGEEYTITPTVEDQSVFDYLEPVIHKIAAEKK